MRVCETILLVFLVTTSKGLAEVDLHSGNAFLDPCKSFITDEKGDPFLMGLCAATVGTVRWFGPEVGVCVPKDVTNGQSLRVVVAYLEKHPELTHKDFAGLAWIALSEAWPCSAKKN
jgi:hypothetical protein